jgi:hypothetical protein
MPDGPNSVLKRELPDACRDRYLAAFWPVPHGGRERAVRRSALEPHDDAGLDEVRKLVGIPVRHADAAMRGVLVNLRGVGCAVQAVGRLG